MSKIKWGGEGDPTINNFYKIDIPFKVWINQSKPKSFITTEVDRNTP